MKYTPLALAALFVSSTLAHSADAPKLESQQDKVSYSIGVDIGGTLKRQGIEIDPAKLIIGLTDAYAGGKIALTDEEIKTTMESFQKELMTKAAVKRDEDGKKNKETGEKFLADNKKKEGVKTTASGLQYKVITEGKGAKPKESDTVVTHYRGTTIDGKEFDSSYKRNEPAEFPLAGVIPGWTEGLQLITVGSKAQFVIPADLAYGDQAPPEIGPGQTLLFEVELLEIKAPEAAIAPDAPQASEAPEGDGAEATPTPAAKTPAAKK